MAFPLEDLPVDHFQGAGKLSENESDCLRNLMNRMRKASDFSGYQVDPNDSDKYATLAEAWTVADAAEAAGAEIKFVLADGTYSDNVDFGNDHPIVIESINHGMVKITGDLTFGASAAKLKRTLIGIECESNTITVEDGCDLDLIFCVADKTTFALDPTAGTVGYIVHMFGGAWSDAAMAESAASSGTRMFILDGVNAAFSPGTLAIPTFSTEDTDIYLINVTSLPGGFGISTNATYPVFDFNSNNAELHLSNFDMLYYGAYAMSANGGSMSLFAENAKFVAIFSTHGLNFGSFDTDPNVGFVDVVAATAPPSPPLGTKWHDLSLKDVMVWDGTYWGNGTLYRKDLLVDVGSAAVSHTSGWAVPTGAGVLNVSANALKALTGAGGATLYGISDGSDGDKYAESAAIIKNSKASAKQASINVGSGDTIYVHSMTSTGTEGGTLAGSNDADVRVVVYFTMPKTLPTV